MIRFTTQWNVTTHIWLGSNVSFFAALYCSCLYLKALLVLSGLEITAYLPSQHRREAIRAVIKLLKPIQTHDPDQNLP